MRTKTLGQTYMFDRYPKLPDNLSASGGYCKRDYIIIVLLLNLEGHKLRP
jgi:hypothetical protein